MKSAHTRAITFADDLAAIVNALKKSDGALK
jgi:hypothetical protein